MRASARGMTWGVVRDARYHLHVCLVMCVLRAWLSAYIFDDETAPLPAADRYI